MTPKRPQARTARGSRNRNRLAANGRTTARASLRPGTAPACIRPVSVSERIELLGGWQADTLAHIRRLIHEADPDVVEECKWAKASNPLGVPVWSHNGIVCTGEAYKNAVKLTFPRGASLADPRGLFNASLQGVTRRAIDIREGERLSAPAFKALVKAAVSLNVTGANKRQASTPRKAKVHRARAVVEQPAREGTRAAGRENAKDVMLLSGGNPQIAKGDGDAPVRAYIAAMPGWKKDAGKRLDALIVRSVPDVRKAVK